MAHGSSPKSVHILAFDFARNKIGWQAGADGIMSEINGLLIFSLLINGVTVVCESAHLYNPRHLPSGVVVRIGSILGTARHGGKSITANPFLSRAVPAPQN
jgi:hypothetical protein